MELTWGIRGEAGSKPLGGVVIFRLGGLELAATGARMMETVPGTVTGAETGS